MRVRLSGSTITAHGDNLGTPYVEFPGNEPLGFSTNWTVSGSSPNRKLVDPHGHEYSVELPTQTAPGGGGSGVTVDNGVDAPAAVTTLVAPGAVIAGDMATLVYLQQIGPFRVDFDTPGLGDNGVAVADLSAGTLVIRAWMIFRTIWDQPGTVEVQIGHDPASQTRTIVSYIANASQAFADNAYARLESDEAAFTTGTQDSIPWATPTSRIAHSVDPNQLIVYAGVSAATTGSADIYAILAIAA